MLMFLQIKIINCCQIVMVTMFHMIIVKAKKIIYMMRKTDCLLDSGINYIMMQVDFILHIGLVIGLDIMKRFIWMSQLMRNFRIEIAFV